MRNIRANLRRRIAEMDLNVSSFARKADCPRVSLSQLLNQRQFSCTVPYAEKLAHAAGMTLGELVADPPKRKRATA